MSIRQAVVAGGVMGAVVLGLGAWLVGPLYLMVANADAVPFYPPAWGAPIGVLVGGVLGGMWARRRAH